jgi:uncharacterized protein (TIGR00369 family)
VLAAFSSIPCNRYFGLTLRSRSSEDAEAVLPLKPEYGQEGGMVHGGIITLLADTTAVYALFPDVPPEQRMTSIEFKVNFLRPALPSGGDLVARAQVVRRGKRVALCDVDVFQDGKAVAKGLFTYLMY